MASFRPILIATLVLAASNAFATLHVYEGFDMGGANDTTNGISGKAGATSLGFDAGSAWNNEGSGVNHYFAAGLTFGSGASQLQTTGGLARLAGTTTGNTSKRPSRPLDVNLMGTLWGSWLIHPEAKASSRVWAVGVNDAPTGVDNSGLQYYSFAENNFISTNSLVSTVGNGAAAASGTTIPINATSMLLFKIADVGGSSGAISIKQWVLNSGQFDYFKSHDNLGNLDAGLSETELDAVTLGASATQVLQRLSTVITTPNAYPQITDSHFMQIFTYSSAANVAVARFDELRLAVNGSGAVGGGLDEVSPLLIVPEAAAWRVWSLATVFAAAWTIRTRFARLMKPRSLNAGVQA